MIMSLTFTKQLKQSCFTDKQITELIDISSPLELPTRHILVNQGELTESAYFVLDGLCHACYLTDDGKQYSKEFYWECDWVLGFESLINQQTSPFLLETLTPVTLLSFPVETIAKWRTQGNPLYIKLLETQLLYKEAKERFMLLYSPQQRYQLFCESYPQLENRLTDYQIAAYLGISHISLSRIKNRLKNRT